MRQNRARESAFGGDARWIGVGFELADAEPKQMRVPGLGIGEAAFAFGREPSRQGRRHALLAHIGERLVIDDIVREPGARAFEEVHAALRIGRPEPGEAVVADPRADRVAPLVARPTASPVPTGPSTPIQDACESPARKTSRASSMKGS